MTHPWLNALKVYSHPRVIGMLFLGFSAGLPLLLVLGTLSFWLSEAGISRATIGHLSWVGLAYGFKFLWSPLVDRLPLPFLTAWLGKRRAWLLLSQICIAAALLGMANTDPVVNLAHTVYFALAVAFASATQDIALDAYRIEAVAAEKQGAMAATYQAGYRLAMITAGAGALWIAASVDPSESTYDFHPWQVAYTVMAALMVVGMFTTLLIREPEKKISTVTTEREAHTRERFAAAGLSGWLLTATAWFYSALLSPFIDFIQRYKWQAALMLALIATYRISDVVMGVMSNPFYQEMGFTKDEVATVSKVYGVIMTILGAGLGGLLVMRIGVMRTLFLGAVLSAATNLLFVWLAGRGHDVGALVFTISADNLSAGIASSAFVAYLSSLVNQAYSATQYALFTSVMLLLPKFIAGFSGEFVDAYGWANFFTGTALIGVPVLILVWLVGRYGHSIQSAEEGGQEDKRVTSIFNTETSLLASGSTIVPTPTAYTRALYLLEVSLVVVPSTLFLLSTFPWLLVALSLKSWTPSLVLFILWVAGWFGVIALFQMFFQLYSSKFSKLKFIWAKLLVGLISALFPIWFVFSSAPDGGNRAGFLLFLFPIAVGIHWTLALRAAITNKTQ